MARTFCRVGMLLPVLAASAAAQFAELAATDDGKQLYFTSQMLLKGVTVTSSWPESRLFRFAAEGVTIYAERGPLAPDGTYSSSDGISGTRISGDGGVIGFTYNDICADQACRAQINRAVIRGRQSMDLGNGVVQVSRDGKWALLITVTYDYGPPPRTDISGTLVDLTTGLKFSTPVPAYRDGDPAFTLASGGAVLAYSPAADGTLALGVWKAGSLSPVTLPPNSQPAALSDNAAVILCYGFPAPRQPRSSLFALDVASGKSTVIYNPPQGTVRVPILLGLSNNGQRVLYQILSSDEANGKTYVWDAVSGATTPVPLADGELVTAGTMSGLGDFAFVATNHSRIVRFTLDGGAVAPLFPGAPYCDDPGNLGAGSMVRLHCSFSGSVGELQDKIQYQWSPIPVLGASANEVVVQIPWQFDNFTPRTLEFDVPGDSPFQAMQPVSVFLGAPAVVPSAAGQSTLFGIVIVKGDWSGLVTTPPVPGDIVHIYMTGLGPVQYPEQTGMPASVTRPNPIQWKLSCRFLPQAKSADLLFAGLAPGMIGVYQTTFRIPADAGAQPLTGLECTLDSPVMRGTFGPGTAAPPMFGSGFVLSSPLP